MRKRFTEEANEVGDKMADVVESKIDAGRIFASEDVVTSAPAAAPAHEAVGKFDRATVDAMIDALCQRYSHGGGCPLGELRELQRAVAALE